MAKVMLPNHVNWRTFVIMLLLAFGLAGLSVPAAAQSDTTLSKIANTRHNLSKSGAFTVKSPATTGESQICVFCHTPHAASTTVKAPLWNRAVNTNTTGPNTYKGYTSSSLDSKTNTANFTGLPGGSSLLCLSCHDGTLALGNVKVLPRGTGTAPGAAGIALDGTDSGKMHAGSAATAGSSRGALTGFTRVLGTDLSNDHPISITYNDTLVGLDGELQVLDGSQRYPAAPASPVIGLRSSGVKPLLPLEPTGAGGLGQVQCATCHDPHITREKFLRLNRFQSGAPGATFAPGADQICLACHSKLGLTWANSAHASTGTGSLVYKDDASDVRGFTRGKKVFEVACLNCHDTHTASGSRRLLREGTGAAPSLTSGTFQAGTAVTDPSLVNKVSAIENTCYQCHTTTAISILNAVPVLSATAGVPDIKAEFGLTYHMPIKTSEQKGSGSYTIGTVTTTYNNPNDKEAHDITNADFVESQASLGRDNTNNRHVECTDCHNPHRVIKNALFNGKGATDRRTHVPAATTALALNGSGGNIASGALRGAWGVEPVFGAMGTTWPQNPSSFNEKKGDPGTNISTARSETYLTREYQLCFKCHSNFANGDTAASYPYLGNTGGGTASGTNGMRKYTNVAAEFGSVKASDPAAGSGDQGEVGESSAGVEDNAAINPIGSYPADATDAKINNHRSWHPVMWPTGRTRDERRMAGTGGNFRAPFDTNVGTQTMHCSDCHGNPGSWSGGPLLTQVQGPHGSTKPFLLKGDWSTSVTLGSTGLCGNCHNPTSARCDSNCTGDGLALGSGFNDDGADGGGGHSNEHSGRPCMRCHVAVPHGWKNKAFLVNLNCVGTEGGQASECVNVTGSSLSAPPYYNDARLRVNTWRASGNWTQATCGGKDWMDNNCG